MAIISFWSGEKKQSGQTLSMVATATHMAVEHNLRILMVDATFQDDTIDRCYWRVNDKKDVNKILNKGKMDIASGAEGLVSAVASNKTSPEIIPNYTKVVLKNRLDVLCGLKTQIPEEYQKSLMLYKDLLNVANKYYDMVFVDVAKTLDEDTTKALLKASQVIVYTFPQNLKLIDRYMEIASTEEILKNSMVVPVMSNADNDSTYNVKNATRYIGAKQELAAIEHNATFMVSACEAGVSSFFLSTRLSKKTEGKNFEFVKSVDGVCKQILYKLEELKYK